MICNNMRNEELIEELIDLAIEEDISTGDISTDAIIPVNSMATAVMTAKADGVVSGFQGADFRGVAQAQGGGRVNVDEQYDVVLRLLAKKPLRMADVVRETGLSEAQVGIRLRTLRMTGEVIVSKKGKDGDWLWKRV